jgi:general secretion pathway protein K
MTRRSQRGGALLAVLWLSAALTAIGFAVASTVAAETERAATSMEGMRAYYLAQGALERAMTWMIWGGQYRNDDGSAKYYEAGMPRMMFEFPGGLAVVEIAPEAARFNINRIPAPDLAQVIASLGEPGDRAGLIAAAIDDWRSPAPEGLTLFDEFYMRQQPSFRARHASFEETEELLLVRGVTPELFYGRYERADQGRLVPRGGLRDCVSPWGSMDSFDANTVHPAVLASLGMPWPEIAALEARRSVAPFRNARELNDFRQNMSPTAQRLRLGGNTIFTLRATARLRLPNGGLSDMRRSVAMTVKLREAGSNQPVEVLRWYDNAFSDRNVF